MLKIEPMTHASSRTSGVSLCQGFICSCDTVITFTRIDPMVSSRQLKLYPQTIYKLPVSKQLLLGHFNTQEKHYSLLCTSPQFGLVKIIKIRLTGQDSG